MPLDRLLVLDRVRSLLATSSRDPRAPDVEEMEHTLTDGYAAALALEGKCLRISRRMAELSQNRTEAGEIRDLAGRLKETEGELTELRGLLDVLRRRAEEARRRTSS
jgi:hypothetical protein